MVEIKHTHDDFISISINGEVKELKMIDVMEQYSNNREVMEQFRNFIVLMSSKEKRSSSTPNSDDTVEQTNEISEGRSM